MIYQQVAKFKGSSSHQMRTSPFSTGKSSLWWWWWWWWWWWRWWRQWRWWRWGQWCRCAGGFQPGKMKADERWRPAAQKPEQQVCHESHDAQYLDRDRDLIFIWWFNEVAKREVRQIWWWSCLGDLWWWCWWWCYLWWWRWRWRWRCPGGGWPTVHTEAEQWGEINIFIGPR